MVSGHVDGVGEGAHRRSQLLSLDRLEAEDAAAAALEEDDRLAVLEQ